MLESAKQAEIPAFAADDKTQSEARNDWRRYPPIRDYAFIGDCHSAALVSKHGSIDWCCMPRFDSDSCFGRILDWDKGGFCQIQPEGTFASQRKYIEGTLVLETEFQTSHGIIKLTDCFSMRKGGKLNPRRELVRIVDGIAGEVNVTVQISPRFSFGTTKPWLRHECPKVLTAIGGNDSLIINSDMEFEICDLHDLSARLTIGAGNRFRLSLTYADPADLDREQIEALSAAEIDDHLQEAIDWWKRWSSDVDRQSETDGQVLRSSMVLKALTYAPTGAIIAAPTTSLPEGIGGNRNWDYRYSWIRDATFSLRALAEVGCYTEAEEFRKFIMRSAAGSGQDLQIMYGIHGERRLTENVLGHLEGYRKSQPVRIGNEAYKQLQTDVYGELVHLLWVWHLLGESPSEDYWRFLVDLADAAAEKSKEPDRGLWEIRGEPRHFVHSKVMCWSALNRAIKLADGCKREVPSQRWQAECDRIKREIYECGIDKKNGNFRQSYETDAVDSALLLLPITGFVAWDDPIMLATTKRIQETLMRDGLLLRYDFGQTDDGLNQKEGAFLACSFWLVECLAHQGKVAEAQEYFLSLCEKSNDLGLFSEEYDPVSNELLGNFPQGLTHLSHIAAAVAISKASQTQ